MTSGSTRDDRLDRPEDRRARRGPRARLTQQRAVAELLPSSDSVTSFRASAVAVTEGTVREHGEVNACVSDSPASRPPCPKEPTPETETTKCPAAEPPTFRTV